MVQVFFRNPVTTLARASAALLLCAAMSAHAQTTISVSSAAQLQSAVQTANSAGGNRIISVADGTYTLSDTLYVNAPNVSIIGASGNRANVIIQGTGMSASASVGTIIRVAGERLSAALRDAAEEQVPPDPDRRRE